MNKTVNDDDSVSVRLEGGLGDHILGMRVLPFIRDRYPDRDIVVYSDSAGSSVQLEIAAMSPLISRVVSVYSVPKNRCMVGRLENIRVHDLVKMLGHAVFIDAWGGDMFSSASTVLQVPVFDILARRPELLVTTQGEQQATRMAEQCMARVLIAINFTKYGSAWIRAHDGRIKKLLRRLLEFANVGILNIYASRCDYGHWPEPERSVRLQNSLEEARVVSSWCDMSPRIIPCGDLPISTVAALLARCQYFVGVDNGIKHLAWALNVPHTYFHPEPPRLLASLRWMPDIHRMLLIECAEDELDARVAEIGEMVAYHNQL